MSTILVIDDAETIRKTLQRMLMQEGFAVISAADGSTGLEIARQTRPDLVLCDADMPGLSGHALCRVLRADKKTASLPIVIMSGSMLEERDVVSGLEGGADDYLIKPFTQRVLSARLNAVMRRYHRAPAAEASLKSRGITLDPASREAKVAGKPVTLTRKEFDLLALFIEHPGRVLTSNFLLEAIWGYDLADYNDPRTVETHISRLRRKLGPKGRAIVNLRGLGYKFEG